MRRAVALGVAVWVLGVGPTSALFTSASLSPGNALATGSGTWFSGNAVGTALCVGMNATLACPYGTQGSVGKFTATIALQNKSAAATYTVSIVDGTGPVAISTIVSATFASNASPSVALPAGGADAIAVLLRLKGNTPPGTYIGALVIADTLSGQSVSIPIWLTH